MNWEALLGRPVAVVLGMIAIMALGLVAAWRLPVSNLPDVEFPTLSVSASLPGADPESMAALVATPLEREFAAIPGLVRVSSQSSAGATNVTLEFALDRNIDAAALDVQAALGAVNRRLPQGMTTPPSMRKVNPADQPFLLLSLNAEALPPSRLHALAEDVVAPRLATLPGVAQVNIFGPQKRAIRVQIDPSSLQAHRVAAGDVATALARAARETPVGSLQGPGSATPLRALPVPVTPGAYSEVVVAQGPNGPIRVGAVAHVVEGVENPRQASWYDGRRGLVLALSRQPGANTIASADAVRALLPQLQQELPAAAKLELVFDRSGPIRESVRDVLITLVLAGALVVAVIYAYLRSASATFIAAMSLPTAILGAFGALYLYGGSIDILSLLALTLATGFVVDDAIVVLEAIHRRVEQGEPAFSAARHGLRDIGWTILAMTLSLVAVFLPLFLLEGIVGRLFREFAYTISAAIALSGVVALALVPAMAARLLKAHPPKEAQMEALPEAPEAVAPELPALRTGPLPPAPEGPPTRQARGRALAAHALAAAGPSATWAEKAYARAAGWCLSHPAWTFGVLIASAMLTAFMWNVVPKGFLPTEDIGQLVVTTQGPPGAGFGDMAAKQQRFAKMVGEHPAVMHVASSVGAGGPNATGSRGRMFVILKPHGERKQDADAVARELVREGARLVGLQVNVLNPPSIRLGGLAQRTSYQVLVTGNDWPSAMQGARAMEAKLKASPGLVQVSMDQEEAAPQIGVRIDAEAAAAVGVAPAAAQDALADAFAGRAVATAYEGGTEVPIVMELAPDRLGDVRAISELPVRTQSGGLVPLGVLASTQARPGPTQVQHVGQRPATSIGFSLAPGVSLDRAAEAVAAAASELPPGTSWRFTGAAEAFADSQKGAVGLLLLAVVVVYVLLGLLYESFIHPITILASLPSAAVGALVSLWALGLALDLFGLVGLVLLVGIVKKNAIMMIDVAVERRRQGESAAQAIAAAGAVRLRPITMTTVAAIAGALPIALGLGAGGESRAALGVAVVGGLLGSQLLTLLATPVLYVALDRVDGWLQRRMLGPGHLPEETAEPALA